MARASLFLRYQVIPTRLGEDPSELVSVDKIGETISVIGRARSYLSYKDDYDDDDKLGSRDCDDDESPDHDCDDGKSGSSNCDDDDKSSDHDCNNDKSASDDCDEHYLMSLNAIAVEAGDFLQLEGNVATDADKAGFDLDVTSGSIVSSETLPVALQAGTADFNGTRIVSKTGKLLDYTGVIAPRKVSVDSVLDINTTADFVKAALVIVDISGIDTTQITGTVLTTAGNSLVLSPDDTVCGITGDLSVTLKDNAVFTTVTITDTGSEIMPSGTLVAGQSVGLSGSCTASGYTAHSVVIVINTRS